MWNKGEVEGKSLLDAMRDGDTEGMQHFDGEIEKLIREGLIDYDTAMAYATNPGNLRLQLSDLLGEAPETAASGTAATGENQAGSRDRTRISQQGDSRSSLMPA